MQALRVIRHGRGIEEASALAADGGRAVTTTRGLKACRRFTIASALTAKRAAASAERGLFLSRMSLVPIVSAATFGSWRKVRPAR